MIFIPSFFNKIVSFIFIGLERAIIENIITKFFRIVFNRFDF